MFDPIPVFEDGVPERITVAEFKRHMGMNFPKLLNKDNLWVIEEAIDSVYTMFSGVGTIWSNNPRPMWYSKTQLCYRLLAAWYIGDLYPWAVSKVPTMGGIPLKSKKIGDVQIVFSDTAVSNPDGNFRDELGSLKSNVWGGKAYLMITSSIATKRTRQAAH